MYYLIFYTVNANYKLNAKYYPCYLIFYANSLSLYVYMYIYIYIHTHTCNYIIARPGRLQHPDGLHLPGRDTAPLIRGFN